MAALSPASASAIARLRAFAPPPTNYYSLPLTRRAAVLILLFADRRGDLRVVLTIRSAKLKNYAGQAALPGGKADSLAETPWLTARREAWEEIGLPERVEDLPRGWEVERLAELPCNLAVTELGVRPCVGWLKARRPGGGKDGVGSGTGLEAGGGDGTRRVDRGPGSGAMGAQDRTPDPVRDLLPTLDAKEVAAVFTAPFHNFLRKLDEDEKVRRGVPGTWYQGTWINWHEEAWRMHQFFVPRGLVFRSKTGERQGDGDNPASADQAENTQSKGVGMSDAVREARRDEGMVVDDSQRQNSKVVEDEQEDKPPDPLDEPRYKVFGMTARILVDCARVAYGEEPDYEHNSHFGDEDMIARLMRMGRLGPVRKQGETLTRDVMRAAAKI